MTAIGIDTHKATLAACAVDELGRPVAEATFANDPAGHLAFIAWARSIAPEVTIGVEGSSSFGAPLARSAHSAGLAVREVPPYLSRVERLRTRRPGKSDPGDALAIARVTAREKNLPPIRLSDRTTELRLLLEAREDLLAESNRARNRLHAHLLTLTPGYGGKVANLVAARHRAAVGRLLRGVCGVQAELARGLLLRLARLEREVKALTSRIGALVAGHPLLGLPGAGPITADRLIAEVGDTSAQAPVGSAGVQAPGRGRRRTAGGRLTDRGLCVVASREERHPTGEDVWSVNQSICVYPVARLTAPARVP